MAEGASYLDVALPQMLPKPPDVAIANQVPGGQLVACTPAEAVPLVGRSALRLSFPFAQGVKLTLRRIHLSLQVAMEERELEKATVTNTRATTFKTEEERKNVGETGGFDQGGETTTPIGYARPFERVVEEKSKVAVGLNTIEYKDVVKTERSVIPVTVTVVVRLVGPDGEMWSDSFDAPLRYQQGNPPAAIGVGHIDSYSDLVNAIDIYPEKTYSLAFFILVPSSVKTDTRLNSFNPGAPEARLFFDVATVPVGK